MVVAQALTFLAVVEVLVDMEEQEVMAVLVVLSQVVMEVVLELVVAVALAHKPQSVNQVKEVMVVTV
jgi:hypothetical protein